MERMSPLDWLFLHVEDDVSHMHIGSVALFEGPAPRYEQLADLVAAKLPALPRYRQRVRSVPLDVGRALWVEDPHFTLDYHLRHTVLPRPGGEAQLRRLVARVMALPLDRARPLWEMWLIAGVEQERWGLLCKLHHCMVDGVAASDLLGVLLASEPSDAPAVRDEWLPAPAPSTARVLAQTLSKQAVNPLQHARTAVTLARDPRRVVRAAVTLASGLISLRGLVGTPTARSLNRPLSRQRQWIGARARLEDVKTIKNALGGSVNDVVLACVAGAFRELLFEHGEPVFDELVVSTLVPVSVRTPDARGTDGNHVSAMFAQLPVGLEDPVERLHAVATQMDARKHSGQALAGVTLTEIAGFCPPLLLSLGARAFTRLPQRRLQTVATNVPGPQQSLYLCRRRMLEVFPYVPLALEVRLGIAICSYDGMLSFGITGDGDDASDIETLARGVTYALEELLQRSAAVTHPHRALNPAVASTHREARPPPWRDESAGARRS